MLKLRTISGLFLFMIMIVPGLALHTELRQIEGFNAIKASGSMDVILEKGNNEMVKVESEQTPLEYIITEVEGTTLHIYLKKPGMGWSGYKGKITVYVSYQSLNEINCSGSGDVRCKSELKASDFVVSNSGSGDVLLGVVEADGKISITSIGSGDIGLGRISAENFMAKLTGSGDMKVGEGWAGEVELSLSGSGDISAANLKGKKVKASISGSGDISIGATEYLNARISGSGDIRYNGSPRTDINKSGSGSVKSF